MRLTGFELSKIWRKKSFQLLMVLLVSVNLFFLWYLHLPGETPPLSSYRALQQELSGKTEAEKKVFLTRLHEEMEIYALVNEILLYQSRDDQFAQVMREIVDMGAAVVGGCCGTTPEHIRALRQIM